MKRYLIERLVIPHWCFAVEGKQYAEETPYLGVYCCAICKSQEVEPTNLSAELNKENRIYTRSVILLSLFVTWVELESTILGGGTKSLTERQSPHLLT